MQQEPGTVKAAGERVRLASPAPSDQIRRLTAVLAEDYSNHRPLEPHVMGRELVRPSTPALPDDVELPLHAYMPPPYWRVPTPINFSVPIPVPFPVPIPTPTRARGNENSAPGRRRALLPRWVMRPCVNNTVLVNQPPTPNVADGASELVLVDFVSRDIVRAHESCEDARNPDGPTTCTDCPLFYLTITNAHVRHPM